MIESLVNVFTRNNSIMSKKADSSGGDFQQTLSKYDQATESNQYQSYNDDSYDYAEENQYRENDYSSDDSDAHTSQENEEYDSEADHESDEESTVSESSSSEESTSEPEVTVEVLAEMAALLEKLGVSKEDIAKIKDALATGDDKAIKEELSKLLSTLKNNLKARGGANGLNLKGAAEFIEKLENLTKSKDQNLSKQFTDLIKTGIQNLKTNPVAKESSQMPLEANVENRTDKDIKLNNTKFAEMKEVAQGTKSIKFRTDVDPRFAQDTQKSTQNLQDKLVQTNIAAKAAGAQAGANGNKQGDNGAAGDPTGQSPDFLKKMKTILKVNSQPSQLGEAVQENSSKLQNTMLRPSFMNRATSGKFMQQLVHQIQNMVNSKTTLSASVDFRTAEFGDMKLAAEAQGSNLSVKLSNIASSMKLDIVSLKSELDTELKSLGFDNVELDFGTESETSQRHAFQEEMNKRLGKDQVKLPGDHIADLNAISEWMKNFEKIM
ncbi:MAG: hypothetical protein NE328_16400 [Lentisphaeraceae bacterium]|nr:hypothetical protein [Lentisphaeraceae bacterium]